MAANLAANQKIKFLLGTSTGLNGATIQDGAFYLTTDEHRLYVGDNGNAELLNQDILFVDATDDLPTTGKPEQLCYIRTTHVLAAWIDNKWQQINPNTFVQGATVSTTYKDKTATVTTTLTKNNSDQVTSSFALVGGDGINLEANGQTVTISSTGAGGTKVNLSAEASDNKAVIKQTVIPLTVLGKEDTANQKTDSITLAGGTNLEDITVTGTTDNEVITINPKSPDVTKIEFTNAANNGNGFNLGLEQNATSNTKSANLDPIIRIPNTAADATSETTTDIHFKNGVADLSSLPSKKYIADQITENNKVIDALQFQGVLKETVPSLTDGTQKVGYVYKIGEVNANTEAINNNIRVGDLAIVTQDANYAEDANGFVTAGAKWEVVPSGDDLTYNGKAVSGGFEIVDSANTTVGTISFAAGENTPLTVSAPTTTGNAQTVTITHTGQKASETTEDAAAYSGNEMTVTVVSGVTTNGTGHVTEVKTKSLPIYDTKIDGYADTVTVANGVATITSAISDTKGSTLPQASHKISSETLTLSVDTNKTTLTADLVWGSF